MEMKEFETISRLYEFCLDWHMNILSKKVLCRTFVSNNWSFTEFIEKTKEKNWFTNSMYALLYAEDFGSVNNV